MEEIDILVERIKDYIERRIDIKQAQNNTIDNIVSTTLYGYRGLAVHQFMQYQTTSSANNYTVGSLNPPVVSV